MKLTENENEIILTDTPIFMWTLGTFLFFVCSSVFVIFIYYAYQKPYIFFTLDFSNNPWDSLSSFFLFGLILLCFAFLFILFISMILMTKITIKVNRQEKIVEVRRIGLLKKQIDKYYFPQISKFNTISNPNGGVTQLALKLVNKSKVNLEIGNLPADELAKTLKKLNSFVVK